MYVYVRACVPAHIHMCRNVCVHVCIYVYVCAYVCVFICECVYVYVCAHIGTCVGSGKACGICSLLVSLLIDFFS